MYIHHLQIHKKKDIPEKQSKKLPAFQWSQIAPDNPHFKYVVIHGISINMSLHRKITVIGLYVQMMEITPHSRD
jgi:hypothetical protein